MHVGSDEFAARFARYFIPIQVSHDSYFYLRVSSLSGGTNAHWVGGGYIVANVRYGVPYCCDSVCQHFCKTVVTYHVVVVQVGPMIMSPLPMQLVTSLYSCTLDTLSGITALYLPNLTAFHV